MPALLGRMVGAAAAGAEGDSPPLQHNVWRASQLTPDPPAPLRPGATPVNSTTTEYGGSASSGVRSGGGGKRVRRCEVGFDCRARELSS